MNTLRFISEMNSIRKTDDKSLFESQFIRYTWDKSDLSQEDVDLYINVGVDAIRLKNLRIEYDVLQEIKEAHMDDDRFPVALFDELSEIRKDIDASLKRNKDALNGLNTKRTDRLNELQQSFGTVLNLVEAFRSKQTRDQWLILAEKRKLSTNQEKERLAGLDELMCQVFGLAKEEV